MFGEGIGQILIRQELSNIVRDVDRLGHVIRAQIDNLGRLDGLLQFPDLKRQFGNLDVLVKDQRSQLSELFVVHAAI